MRSKTLVCLFALCAPMCASSQMLRPAFTRQDQMPAFQVPGSKATYPLAINDANTITGSYIDQANVVHGFVRDSAGTITTFDVPGSVLTEPSSINTAGDITGHYETPNSPTNALYSYFPTVPQGFLRKADGSIVTFGTINPTSSSGQPGFWAQPVAINDADEIIGNDPSISLGSQVFVRAPDGTISSYILNLGADYNTIVTGLNNGGTQIGYYSSSSLMVAQGYAWDGQGTINPLTGPTYAISVPGSVGTFPSSVNAEGAAVGTYTTQTASQAFLRNTDGTYETIATPAGTTPGCPIGITVSPIVYNPPPPPLSINNQGTVIGCYKDTAGNVTGFVRYEDGTTTPLTHAGSQQTRPTAINSSGIITGFYTVGANVMGFILEPSAR
jgi:hypothetical protein